MSGDALQSPTAAGLAGPCARFRTDLREFAPREDAGDRRHTLYDARNDLSYFLGPAELRVAKLFDGHRRLSDIAAILARDHHQVVPEARLAAFEHKLSQLGLVEVPGGAAARPMIDPSIGISYGPLKSMLMVPVLRMDPTDMLDALYRRMGWLCTPACVFAGLILVVLAGLLVLVDAGRFARDAGNVYGNGLGWLLWHYPVVVVSIFFHEIGHALTCRHYRVRITDFGIAVYLLLATGWARPLQADWSILTRRQRLVSIALGPGASLLFAAVGVFLWWVSGWALATGNASEAVVSVAHTLGVVMAVSATVALVPTLLPMFNGDTYLAITELLGVPRLRQRAFRHLRGAWRGRPPEEPLSRGRRWLYGATVMATVLGWIAIWAVLLNLGWRILQWLQG